MHTHSLRLLSFALNALIFFFRAFHFAAKSHWLSCVCNFSRLCFLQLFLHTVVHRTGELVCVCMYVYVRVLWAALSWVYPEMNVQYLTFQNSCSECVRSIVSHCQQQIFPATLTTNNCSKGMWSNTFPYFLLQLALCSFYYICAFCVLLCCAILVCLLRFAPFLFPFFCEWITSEYRL